MDSQCKYAAVAGGDASIYLRLPTRADYEEKIWDHAAGYLIIREAGGQVSDIHGEPLDFSQGRTLSRNKGVVATNGKLHTPVIAAIQQALASE
jgi:3'(2'), 5'-bisphosphate nucleotidase